MEIFSAAETWVGVGLIIFLGILVVLKVPKLVLGKLDDRSAAIQAELDEAKAIREEAVAMLARLKAEHAEAEANAAEMLANARAEAKQFEAEAAAKLERSIALRQRAAEGKIAAAEAAATTEVKAAAAELAAQLAEGVLAARIKGAKTDALVDSAIKDMAGRLQ